MDKDKVPIIEQEWSLHAQLTFSHGIEEPISVRYSPASELPNLNLETQPTRAYHPCYGFQRGNIIFTTKPRSPPPPSIPATNYGSLPSSNSRRTPQPYNRRCMSTCNIVLGSTLPSTTTPCHHAIKVTTCDMCDVCSGGGRSPTATRRAHTFTSHFCTRVPDKSPAPISLKDASSQTSRTSLCPGTSTSTANTSYKIPPAPSINNSCQVKKQRSPARYRKKSPILNNAQSPDGVKNQKKQPRTVHIDVYCTASEHSSSDGSDSGSGDESSPSTVYESEKVKVSHKRETSRTPQGLVRQKRRTLSEGSSLSSLYPSRMNSSSLVVPGKKIPNNSTTTCSGIMSETSSCALFSDDSATATSWKDTSTELMSLQQSDISLANTESFEYADYTDKLRIMEKEKAWGTEHGRKTWRSPENQRRHHLQMEKQQKYIQRKGSPFPLWKADDSSEESDGSSYTEMAYSFGRLEEISKLQNARLVKRDDTVRLNKKEAILNNSYPLKRCESGSFSDSGHVSYGRQRESIGPFGKKEETPPKEKFESCITAPFTATPGIKTEQLSKAEKFGSIIKNLKKPGHHVGPSKNPDCLCDNCRQYFEEKCCTNHRNRTKSVGEISVNERVRWKSALQNLHQHKRTDTLDMDDPSLV